MALRNLLHAASLLAATSTKIDPRAHCLKAFGYIIRSEMVKHTNCHFHQISGKAAFRAIVSDSLQTERNSKATVVCMLKG